VGKVNIEAELTCIDNTGYLNDLRFILYDLNKITAAIVSIVIPL
jgi:hypothetical protein